MGMDNAYDSNRRNAVIVNADDNQVLRAFSADGWDWCDDLVDAWRTDTDSKVATRIAQKVGGKVVPIAELV